MPDVLSLAAGDASATIALRGAEPLSWRVGGRELLWHGDPEHWEFRAPLLFPVVGASRRGVVEVGGRAHPMPQHGFARRAGFSVAEASGDRATLLLVDDPETRGSYPFAFALGVAASLSATTLRLDVSVENRGEAPMPYALGFHPAFLWPFDAPDRAGHAAVFAEPERAEVPEVAAGGLLARTTRAVPLAGRTLPLAPDLFTEALVFLDAASRSVAFRSPTGAAIAMETEGFPHLAIWSRESAPFLSLECWTGHADWADAEGELARRDSMILLAPGETRRHAVTLRHRPA